MTASTLYRVSGLILGWLLMARDTVLGPTPHFLAISLIVISPIFHPSFFFFITLFLSVFLLVFPYPSLAFSGFLPRPSLFLPILSGIGPLNLNLNLNFYLYFYNL